MTIEVNLRNNGEPLLFEMGIKGEGSLDPKSAQDLKTHPINETEITPPSRKHGPDAGTVYLPLMVAVMAQLLGDDEFKGFATPANSVDWNSLIERCQFASFVKGQSQQVDVCDLNMGDDCIGFEDLKDTDILSPKVMAWGLTKLAKDGKYGGDIPWPVWEVRVAGNADKSIFGQRTGCPGLVTLFREPAMG